MKRTILILLVLITAPIWSQQVAIANYLPGVLKEHFDEPELVKMISALHPESNVGVTITYTSTNINLSIAIQHFDPEQSENFSLNTGPCYISTSRPLLYMTILHMWLQDSLYSMPDSLSGSFSSYNILYVFALQKDDNSILLMQGYADLWEINHLVSVEGPIIISNGNGTFFTGTGPSEYGSASGMLRAGMYPLNPPFENDGNRTDSWPVFAFFDKLPTN